MTTRLNHATGAFTRIELIVVLVVVLVLVSMIIPAGINDHAIHGPRIQCLNNLKQIGVAYRVWEYDNGGRYPALQLVAKGGWGDLLTNPNQGFMCWTNYAIMEKDMGLLAKNFVCPSDERKPAQALTNFANFNVSYFVGVSASDNQQQSFLGGDRNLGPGTEPSHDFGFSPENGKGNDVAIQTDSQTAPVCWSLKMHSLKNLGGAGNILLGDGSASEVNSASLCSNWLNHADPTTNWPAGLIPSAPSIRVLFP